MLEIIRLFPLLAALGCAVCAETVVPVEVVEPVLCCVLVVVVVVVEEADAIALLALNPAGKYSVPDVHDSGEATVRLVYVKSA